MTGSCSFMLLHLAAIYYLHLQKHIQIIHFQQEIMGFPEIYFNPKNIQFYTVILCSSNWEEKEHMVYIENVEIY